MDNQSTTPPSTPPQGPTIPETPPPPPPSTPPPGSEPIPPKVQQHLDNNPHANEPIKPHHSKKFYSLLIFMIVVLLLIAGGLTWYLLVGSKAAAPVANNQIVAPIETPTITPTPDPTADWLTYADQKYQFSFRYPTNLTTKNSSECTAGLSAVSLGSENDDDELCAYEFTVLISNKGTKANCFPQSTKELSRRDLIVGGKEAQELVIEDPRGTGKNETVVGFEDGIHCFTVTNREQLMSSDLFSQILTTFVFEEASSISAEGTVTVSPTPQAN